MRHRIPDSIFQAICTEFKKGLGAKAVLSLFYAVVTTTTSNQDFNITKITGSTIMGSKYITEIMENQRVQKHFIKMLGVHESTLHM